MSDFDTSRIPEHVFHDAVYTTLGSEGLRQISGGYNFRCPICGDSKKNKLKKRGYVLYEDDKWVYLCHNECGSMSFLKFLKEYHTNIYKQILFFGFKNKKFRKEIKQTEAEKTYKAAEIYEFKKGELLDIYDDHPLAQKGLAYCKGRKIRKEVYSKWFVCIFGDRFFERDRNGEVVYNDKGYPKGNEYKNRLIIPYYRFGGKWIQFDARALDNSFVRYRNLEDADRELYNIDWLDTSKPFFLLEGSIDSTFIRNSTGFGGTKHLKSFLDEYPEIWKNAHNGTVIWDNDNAGYDEMNYTIDLGFNWFNWSDIRPIEKYMFEEDGSERIIGDINKGVLYSDCFELDNEGYITYNSLEQYIENPVVGRIKIPILYGNRDKMKRQKFKKIFKDANRKRYQD